MLQKFFVNSVIPAVQDKFPRHRFQKIIVQDDNASTHNISEDDEVLAACHNVPIGEIVFQPADSPDFSVLEL